jgi:hypothetical protein
LEAPLESCVVVVEGDLKMQVESPLIADVLSSEEWSQRLRSRRLRFT